MRETIPGADRRRFGRRAVFKQMIIVLDNGQKLYGQVIDLSESGARIQLPDLTLLTPEFYLEIPEDDMVVKCRVVHLQPKSAGIEFCRAPRRLSWLRKPDNSF